MRDVFDFDAESRDVLLEGDWIVGGRMDCGGLETDFSSLVTSCGLRTVFSRIVGALAACESGLPAIAFGAIEIGLAGVSSGASFLGASAAGGFGVAGASSAFGVSATDGLCAGCIGLIVMGLMPIGRGVFGVFSSAIGCSDRGR